MPISTAAYVTLPNDEHGDGAALFTMSRNVIGGIGISVSTALITNHEQIRQQYDKYAEKNQTPSTPATHLLYALEAQMGDIGREGIERTNSSPA